MLAPEVINILPLKSLNSVGLNEEKTLKILKNMHFNHSVTMLLPDTLNTPPSLMTFETDNEYYLVKNLPAYELVNPQFLDFFLINGNLTLQSVNSRVDLDNCVSINSKGILNFLLDSSSYYSSGLDGEKSNFVPDRFVIKLNLKSSQFSPGSKFHLRVAERLSSVPWLTFDVIVAWKPCVNPPTDICPSSIASWFSQAGYSVSTCRVKFQRRTFYNVNMPCYDEEKLEELLEWTGMLLLGCDLNPTQPEINSYCAPTPNVALGQVVALQWSGLLPQFLVESAYESLKEWTDKSSSQWCCMIVHGIEDSISSIGRKEHNFYVEGDYNLSIFLPPNKPCKSITHVSSSKKPKK